MNFPVRLAFRHVFSNKTRNGLTILAITIAVFLLCFLLAVVRGIDAGVRSASSTRLVTQSAVSLFVTLPMSYRPKIDAQEAVTVTSEFRWFGGYYQDPSNFFPQFAVNKDRFVDMYVKDFEIIEGPNGITGPGAREAVKKAFATEKRAAIIGMGLRDDEKYNFKIGDTVPIIPAIYQRADGGAWDYVIVGIFKPLKARIPDKIMYFRSDYLNDSIESGEAFGEVAAGVYYVNIDQGSQSEMIATSIDQDFLNGPQRTQTVTEAAFASFFVSAIGNLPLFLGTVGGAVLFSIFFSVVNAMLIAGRQRLKEAGILQALGFPPITSCLLLIIEGLAVALIGGAFGLALAIGTQDLVVLNFGDSIRNYEIDSGLILLAIGTSSVLGITAGLCAGIPFLRYRPTEALRSMG